MAGSGRAQLPILVSSVVSLYFLEWTDVFKPVKSGFTCHDRSLSLPFVEPTHEVVPLLMLLSLAFAGPAITVGLQSPPPLARGPRRENLVHG
ncbi:unnamed protein product [Boreogadus saida]